MFDDCWKPDLERDTVPELRLRNHFVALKFTLSKEMVESHEFKTECSSYAYSPSAEKALIGAIDVASVKVTAYLNMFFPVRGNLLEKALRRNLS